MGTMIRYNMKTGVHRSLLRKPFPDAMKWTLTFLLGCCLVQGAVGWTYHVSESTMNWTMARHWCQTNHTDMVVIQNQEENDYLVSILPNRTMSPYYWIGITKTHKDDPWTWIGNNSTWIGNRSWAQGEPNNDYITEFCVEIYVNDKANMRGRWNDEKCNNPKYPVCYQAQCNETSCNGGRCLETIDNITCLCEPGFEGERCQTELQTPKPGEDSLWKVVQCDPLSQPDDGYLTCSPGNQTFNSTCGFGCSPGFLLLGSAEVTCSGDGVWSGPRPSCTSYKHALMVVGGCGAFSTICCICFCCIKHRKRKKLVQPREPEEGTSPSTETHD